MIKIVFLYFTIITIFSVDLQRIFLLCWPEFSPHMIGTLLLTLLTMNESPVQSPIALARISNEMICFFKEQEVINHQIYANT